MAKGKGHRLPTYFEAELYFENNPNAFSNPIRKIWIAIQDELLNSDWYQAGNDDIVPKGTKMSDYAAGVATLE